MISRLYCFSRDPLPPTFCFFHFIFSLCLFVSCCSSCNLHLYCVVSLPKPPSLPHSCSQVPDHRELHPPRGEEQDHEPAFPRLRGGAVEVPAPCSQWSVSLSSRCLGLGTLKLTPGWGLPGAWGRWRMGFFRTKYRDLCKGRNIKYSVSLVQKILAGQRLASLVNIRLSDAQNSINI